ncbi:hypothetical protein TNCT_27231 [Trichonephila clavata]|uniref:Uncharacterized protein n=1 Tax=Trichonephila clavata TaxID=2740835 RepID=A0A8X6H0K3_TRICU|nr:hypothetical protein TNCT_27231 [Trichonephila clavata]
MLEIIVVRLHPFLYDFTSNAECDRTATKASFPESRSTPLNPLTLHNALYDIFFANLIHSPLQLFLLHHFLFDTLHDLRKLVHVQIGRQSATVVEEKPKIQDIVSQCSNYAMSKVKSPAENKNYP